MNDIELRMNKAAEEYAENKNHDSIKSAFIAGYLKHEAILELKTLKIGDKVKCVNTQGLSIQLDQEGVVLEVKADSYLVKFDGADVNWTMHYDSIRKMNKSHEAT